METLLQDVDIQDILVLNIERAVQLCSISAFHWISSSGKTSPRRVWRGVYRSSRRKIAAISPCRTPARSVGFRNVAVHQYEKIDWPSSMPLHGIRSIDFRLFSSSILKASKKSPIKIDQRVKHRPLPAAPTGLT